MALDKDTRKYVEAMSALGKIDFNNVPVDQMRAVNLQMANSARKEEVSGIKDHYISPDRKVWMREYVPKKILGHGTILFIHGGGFVFGGVEEYDAFVRHLANTAQMRVFSLAYRLAPEFRFPAAHDDALSAYSWLISNSKSLDLNRDLISVMGDSAGATLSIHVGFNGTGKGEHKPRSLILFYPSIGDVSSTESYKKFSKGFLLDAEFLEWFGKAYRGSDNDQKSAERGRYNYLDFSKEELASFPETMMVTAEYDPLRDNGELFAHMLMENDVSVVSIRANGMIHGFINNYEIISNSELYIQFAASFARKTLI